MCKVNFLRKPYAETIIAVDNNAVNRERRRGQAVKNAKVKVALIENGMKQWQLAQLMGVHEATLSKRMREELPAEEQDRMIDLIEAAEDKQQPKGG